MLTHILMRQTPVLSCMTYLIEFVNHFTLFSDVSRESRTYEKFTEGQRFTADEQVKVNIVRG